MNIARKYITLRMGGGKRINYADTLVTVFGAGEVWPLVDATDGVIPAHVSAARNGTYAGWTPQNAASPISGTLAPYSDGTTGKGDILTANGTTGLADIFDPVKGWLVTSFKAYDAAVWTDGALRYIFQLFTDGNNYLRVHKSSSNNIITLSMSAGGTLVTTNISCSATDWQQVAVTWDKNAGATGELKIYLNGAPESGLPCRDAERLLRS